MWDSGLRSPQPDVLVRARQVVTEHQHRHELLSLDVLASEFGIHRRTLGDAVRLGRLEVHLLTRFAFGRPIQHATLAAVLTYRQSYYRQSYSSTLRMPPPPMTDAVPHSNLRRIT